MTEEEIFKVAQSAHGFVGADLNALVHAASNFASEVVEEVREEKGGLAIAAISWPSSSAIFTLRLKPLLVAN